MENDTSVKSATTVHAVTAPTAGAVVTVPVISVPLAVGNRTGLKCDVQPYRSISYLYELILVSVVQYYVKV